MIESLKKIIRDKIESEFHVEGLVVEEPKKGLADISVPLFQYAKLWKVSPIDVYQKFISVIDTINEIEKLEFMNGFLNIYLKRKNLSENILREILENRENYGQSDIGNGKTVVMDYSSPNIAKSFSVGHLRSTMIGNALKNIYQKTGYQVVAVNHLGDWGTQFGKMIVAYQLWGNDELIHSNPIIELQKLYKKINEEEKTNEELTQKARDAFRKLEHGDPKYIKLWQWFRDESLREFMEMYELLDVKFDSFHGEAFYNDKMDRVVDMLEEKGLLIVDEGATIVDLSKSDLPPALIKKSDGATLYITRDVAAILYRYETYKADKLLYIVGNEQQLHFKQLKAVTDLMGYNFDLEHVNFGLVLVDGKKMSTRSGKFTRLEDVINQAILDAKEAITSKNPDLKDQDMVARKVGVGAIIFNDLKNERHLDVDFNLANMLKFEGMTGPYLQYSSVRIESILRENELNINDFDASYFEEDHYFEVVKQLAQFPHILIKAKEHNAPNMIARYITALAQSFNSFYGKQRINVEDLKHKNANLLFISAIQIVINEGLRILGISPLKEM